MAHRNVTALTAVLFAVNAHGALADEINFVSSTGRIPTTTVTNWSGPFIGAQIGGSFGNTDFTYFSGLTADHRNDGFTGGLYGGYDIQSGENIFGFDLSYNLSSISGSTACPNPAFTCKSKLEDFGAIRGRYGRAFDDMMIYAAAGYAFGNAEFNVNPGGAAEVQDNSANFDGWTVALGIQKMLRSDWALRGEIAYLDLEAGTGDIVANFQPAKLEMDMTTISVGIEKRW